MRNAIHHQTHQLSPTVAEILRTRIACEGNDLRITGDLLSPKTYREVNKALELLGGKWNKSRKVHVFPQPAKPLIDAALSDGEVFNAKKSFQFFETPAPIVKRMIELAELQGGESVLEPSAGRGAIALAAKDAGCKVYICELNEAMAGDLIRSGFDVMTGGGAEDLGTDFLKQEPSPDFDRVLMNPPFTRRQDVLHIRHAFDFLKDDGRLVAICSATAFTGSFLVNKAFAGWATQFLIHREKLAAGTFADSGTNVTAELIVLQKSRVAHA